MGLKSPPDGCWDLIRNRDRMMIDRAEREKDVFIQDALVEPSLGGLTHCRWNVCFLMPQDVMTSPPASGVEIM
jgi:hypothetical protein